MSGSMHTKAQVARDFCEEWQRDCWQMRLSANGNETRCIIFVDSLERARRCLAHYVSRIVGVYPFVSGFGALVNAHRLEEIVGLDFVSAVSPHTTVHTTMSDVRERLSLSKMPLSADFGSGVTVAVIDTGICTHMDFMLPRMRVRCFRDFVGRSEWAYDDNGHGTAVAGIICGNGCFSGGMYRGIAPKCDLIALKAISSSGDGGAFNILEAMQWIFDNRQRYNIRVVCMSFGAAPISKNDPLAIGAQMLWKQGITVVASAGNSGPLPSTIRSPGIDPFIITVGAVDNSLATPKVAEFSSRGPIDGFTKPDIVADGVDIISSSASGGYTQMSGTSMSAPIVAGVCAAMLSRQPLLTPDAIKEQLLKNARPLGEDVNSEGHGCLDIGFLLEQS